jgi:hypothetical protein
MNRFFNRGSGDGGEQAENGDPPQHEEEQFGLFQLWPDPEVERDSPDNRFKTTVEYVWTVEIA